MRKTLGGNSRGVKRAIMGGILMLGLVGCNSIPTSKYEEQARPLTDQFLILMDSGNFRRAFEQPGVNLSKDASQFELWGTEHRTPMGKVIKRTLWESKDMREFYGKPDGEYLDMRFRTEFENKKNGWEGVMLKKANGNWNVIHYYVY